MPKWSTTHMILSLPRVAHPRLSLAVCTLLLFCLPSWAETCQPSQWGPDDELGAANYVTPEQVLMSVKLVKQGQSHPLGIVIDPAMPAFPPRSMSLQVVQPGQHNGRKLSSEFESSMMKSICPNSALERQKRSKQVKILFIIKISLLQRSLFETIITELYDSCHFLICRFFNFQFF